MATPATSLPFALALLAAACGAPPPKPSPPPTSMLVPSPLPKTGYERDPAFLRREILRRQDARIDEAAARAFLEARLALDDAMPIPDLGFDAEPAPGGMRVTNVRAGGAAAAGLAAGDVVLAIGNEPTDKTAALAHAIRGNEPGARVELRVQRDGKELRLPCTVGKRPESDDDDDEQFPDLPRAIPADTGAFAAAFDDLALGATVAAFDSVLGGHGEPPRWIVAGEGSTHCLRQDASDATGLRFPMAIARDFFGSDVAARARARCAGGHAERAGGIVLRYRDPANYLVARVDAAAGDLRIYRVVNGQRRTLPGGIVAAPIDDQWHTLEFCAEGPKLTATLDGKYTAVAYDSFFMKGRAGVWTKSDSVTEFDDIAFEPINKPGTSK